MSPTRPPKHQAPVPNMRAFVARCVWGTDWPHPQMNPLPDAGLLLDQLFEWVPEVATRHRILVENPATLYGF